MHLLRVLAALALLLALLVLVLGLAGIGPAKRREKEIHKCQQSSMKRLQWLCDGYDIFKICVLSVNVTIKTGYKIREREREKKRE